MGAEPDTAHRVSRDDLVLEYICRFSIQLVGELIDPRHVVVERSLRRIAKEAADRFSDECTAIRSDVIDPFCEIVGDRDLDRHTAKVSEECGHSQ